MTTWDKNVVQTTKRYLHHDPEILESYGQVWLEVEDGWVGHQKFQTETGAENHAKLLPFPCDIVIYGDKFWHIKAMHYPGEREP